MRIAKPPSFNSCHNPVENKTLLTRRERDKRTAALLNALGERPRTLFCLALALNALAFPYQGIVLDARLYSFQVLNRVEGGAFSNDLFFRFGSLLPNVLTSWFSVRDDKARLNMIIRERGSPIDAAASRKALGTRSSMSSVVRTTTGSTMIASATDPARAEKCPMRITSTS